MGEQEGEGWNTVHRARHRIRSVQVTADHLQLRFHLPTILKHSTSLTGYLPVIIKYELI